MLSAFLLAAALATVQPSQAPATVPVANNTEMTAMFDADQAIRKASGPADWDKMAADDKTRRERTRVLLDTGKISTADDFHNAAFIFQHGGTADDYLLAHSLALAAVARGRAKSAWIAAATLDRYLQEIGKPQIYGTQYTVPEGKMATQDPFHRALVPDFLRKTLGVPTLVEQEKRRQMIEALHKEKTAVTK